MKLLLLFLILSCKSVQVVKNTENEKLNNYIYEKTEKKTKNIIKNLNLKKCDNSLKVSIKEQFQENLEVLKLCKNQNENLENKISILLKNEKELQLQVSELKESKGFQKAFYFLFSGVLLWFGFGVLRKVKVF